MGSPRSWHPQPENPAYYSPPRAFKGGARIKKTPLLGKKKEERKKIRMDLMA